MTNLKCTVTNCGYNSDNSCSKDSIVVEGAHAENPSATSCKSFELKNNMGKGRGDHTPYGTPNGRGDHTPHGTPYGTLHGTDIECSAETCIFNKKGCCDAREICVGGKSAKTQSATECDSFVKCK